ncbi:MAG: ABC transporter ATP-binding protein, partial [Anaerolineales bacterium]|nr:ABC transporter ATP-binding protein [Anaerolineales bacterium]
MSFFAGLNTEKYDRQYSDRLLAQRIINYLTSQHRRMGAIITLVIVLSLIGVAQPIVMSNALDILKGQPSFTAIGLVGLAVLFVGVAHWGLNWARRSLTVRAVGDVVLELRTQAFRAAAAHDLSFYDQFSSGRIVSRITSDTNDFGHLVVIVTDVASQMIQALLLAIVLIHKEWHMALILFAFMPFIFLLALGYRRIARRVTRRGMQAMANVNATIKETISGIAIAK